MSNHHQRHHYSSDDYDGTSDDISIVIALVAAVIGLLLRSMAARYLTNAQRRAAAEAANAPVAGAAPAIDGLTPEEAQQIHQLQQQEQQQQELMLLAAARGAAINTNEQSTTASVASSSSHNDDDIYESQSQLRRRRRHAAQHEWRDEKDVKQSDSDDHHHGLLLPEPRHFTFSVEHDRASLLQVHMRLQLLHDLDDALRHVTSSDASLHSFLSEDATEQFAAMNQTNQPDGRLGQLRTLITMMNQQLESPDGDLSQLANRQMRRALYVQRHSMMLEINLLTSMYTKHWLHHYVHNHLDKDTAVQLVLSYAVDDTSSLLSYKEQYQIGQYLPRFAQSASARLRAMTIVPPVDESSSSSSSSINILPPGGIATSSTSSSASITRRLEETDGGEFKLSAPPATAWSGRSSSSSSSSNTAAAVVDEAPVVPPHVIVFRVLVSNTGTGGDAVPRWITLIHERAWYTIGTLIAEVFAHELQTGCRVTCLHQGMRLRDEMMLDAYPTMISGSTFHAIIQPPAPPQPVTPATATGHGAFNNNQHEPQQHNLFGINPNALPAGTIGGAAPLIDGTISPSMAMFNTGLMMSMCILVALAGTLCAILFIIVIDWHRPTMAMAWLMSLIAAVLVFAFTSMQGQPLVPRLPIQVVQHRVLQPGAVVHGIPIGNIGNGLPPAFTINGRPAGSFVARGGITIRLP